MIDHQHPYQFPSFDSMFRNHQLAKSDGGLPSLASLTQSLFLVSRSLSLATTLQSTPELPPLNRAIQPSSHSKWRQEAPSDRKDFQRYTVQQSLLPLSHPPGSQHLKPLSFHAQHHAARSRSSSKVDSQFTTLTKPDKARYWNITPLPLRAISSSSLSLSPTSFHHARGQSSSGLETMHMFPNPYSPSHNYLAFSRHDVKSECGLVLGSGGLQNNFNDNQQADGAFYSNGELDDKIRQLHQLRMKLNKRGYRTGAWLSEEEIFLQSMVKYYFNGSLILNRGESLRSILHERLHCSSSRVTKKLQRKKISIGHTMNSRLCPPQALERDICATQHHLLELELQFLHTLFLHDRIQEKLSSQRFIEDRSSSCFKSYGDSRTFKCDPEKSSLVSSSPIYS